MGAQPTGQRQLCAAVLAEQELPAFRRQRSVHRGGIQRPVHFGQPSAELVGRGQPVGLGGQGVLRMGIEIVEAGAKASRTSAAARVSSGVICASTRSCSSMTVVRLSCWPLTVTVCTPRSPASTRWPEPRSAARDQCAQCVSAGHGPGGSAADPLQTVGRRADSGPGPRPHTSPNAQRSVPEANPRASA